MLYQTITGTPTNEMSGWGLQIKLWPGWRDAISRSDLNQAKINTMIEKMGRGWLDACGYDAKSDFGDGVQYVYEATTSIRVQWGEWGPEHITVPGNACGLDLNRGFGYPRGGMVLLPHNIDTMRQAFLLMLVFNHIADYIVLKEEAANRREG